MGDKRVHAYGITFDNSYPTGGEAVTAGLVGLNTIQFVIPLVNGANFSVWDRTNSKLLIYTADGVEAANASDQSAVTVEAVFIGK